MDPAWAGTIGDSQTLKAQVVHAVRQEMALKLEDVVFRRTDLGSGEHPGDGTLSACAELISRELGWNAGRVQSEIDEVRARFTNRPQRK